MRNILKILILIYVFFLSIFFIVELSPLEFTAVSLKRVFYEYTILALPVFGMLLGAYFIRKKVWNIIASLAFGVLGLLILNSIVFSFTFWHSHSVWETKEVIAVSRMDKDTKIVEQWINSGALGYSKGIFKTKKITPFLNWQVDYIGKELDQSWVVLVDRKLEVGD